MGTVGYMSPEQVSGEALDFRSDQFSFGSVLYEMATGKRAFQKKTAIDTLGAILNSEPEPIAHAQSPGPRAPTLDRRALPGQGAPTTATPRPRTSTRELASAAATTSRKRRACPEAPTSRPPVTGSSPARDRGRRARPRSSAGKRLWTGHAPALPRFQQVTFRRGVTWSARFAPDGQDDRLSRRVGMGSQHGSSISTRPGSPESRSLGLASGEHSLDLLERANGNPDSPRRAESAHSPMRRSLAALLARFSRTSVDADWSPDGNTSWRSRDDVAAKIRIEFPSERSFTSHRTLLAIFVSRHGKRDHLPRAFGPGPASRGRGPARPSPARAVEGAGPYGRDPAMERSSFSGPTTRVAERAPVGRASGETRAVVAAAGRFPPPRSRRTTDKSCGAERWATRISGADPARRPSARSPGSPVSHGWDLSAMESTVLIGSTSGHAAYLRKTDGSAAVRLGEGSALALSGREVGARP